MKRLLNTSEQEIRINHNTRQARETGRCQVEISHSTQREEAQHSSQPPALPCLGAQLSQGCPKRSPQGRSPTYCCPHEGPFSLPTPGAAPSPQSPAPKQSPFRGKCNAIPGKFLPPALRCRLPNLKHICCSVLKKCNLLLNSSTSILWGQGKNPCSSPYMLQYQNAAGSLLHPQWEHPQGTREHPQHRAPAEQSRDPKPHKGQGTLPALQEGDPSPPLLPPCRAAPSPAPHTPELQEFSIGAPFVSNAARVEKGCGARGAGGRGRARNAFHRLSDPTGPIKGNNL